jgi:MFS family permease
LTSVIGWRAAFIIVGVCGIAIAPVFRLSVREPVRGQFDAPGSEITPAPMRAVVKKLVGKPSFWVMSFGAASSSMIGYGLIFWLPSFFVRSFGHELPGFFAWMPGVLVPAGASTLLYASYFYGSILLLGGLSGIWLGGALADRFGHKNKAAYALVPACAFIASVPFFVAGVTSTSLGVAFVAFLVPTALSLVWLGPVLSAFQHLVTPNMRATASAIFLFINNLIGLALGNLIIGALSDYLSGRYGDESLRYAMLTGTAFYLVAAAMFFVAAPRLKDDWEG